MVQRDGDACYLSLLGKSGGRCVLGLCLLFTHVLPIQAQTYPCPGGPGGGEVQVGVLPGTPPTPLCNRIGGDDSSPPPIVPKWSTRWGAIAAGDGYFGTANAMTSKRKASKAAIAQCKERGGGKYCKLSIAFYNQCGALASGSRIAIAYSAPERNSAEQGAIKQCAVKGGVEDCQVAYSACSYPVRVR